MFDLIPFGRNERNLFQYLDNVEKSLLTAWTPVSPVSAPTFWTRVTAICLRPNCPASKRGYPPRSRG